jgi:hypothetical protein
VCGLKMDIWLNWLPPCSTVTVLALDKGECKSRVLRDVHLRGRAAYLPVLRLATLVLRDADTWPSQYTCRELPAMLANAELAFWFSSRFQL